METLRGVQREEVQNGVRAQKCIHGSRAKSLIGAIEGTIYTSSHVYDRVARYICPSRFIEEKLLTVPRYAGKTTMIHNF